MMIKINIAKDFSDAPGGRYISEGPFSGELFRNSLLIPKYVEAKKNNDTLEINFDGSFGYSTSFLEESFGGLVRELKDRDVLSRIKIISNEDFTLESDIHKYVKKAEGKL